MKAKFSIIALFAFIATLSACSQGASTGQKEPWTQSQLLAPADLARTLNDPKASQPYIYCIGPQAVIKNSIDIGPTGVKSNLDKLKAQLESCLKTPTS